MPASDLDLLIHAVREGGAIAKAAFGSKVETWDKSKGNPVTEVDLAVDRRLNETLTAARPDYGWLSEESSDNEERLAKRRVFIVDPIDGTLAFIKHKPEFTICAAIIEAGRPTAAAIFNPCTDELYTAAKDRGAHLNARPIRVTAREALAGCRMLVAQDVIRHPAWPEPWPPMELGKRASIAYRLALVAAGEYDAMMALSTKHEWDLAAGDLIIAEAGGTVTTHTGAPIAYNQRIPNIRSILCAGPALHRQMLDRTENIRLP